MGEAALKLAQSGKVSHANQLQLSYGDLTIQDTAAANVAIGDRSVDFFFHPNNFPIETGDDEINLSMHWTDDGDTMTVQRLWRSSNPLYSPDSRVAAEASLCVDGMTDYQRTVAFLYLVGEVMTDGS